MVKLKPAQLDEVFHALSDSTRRGMVQRLSKHPTRISDLAEPFAISLPAISKHVRVLESAGLVTRRKQGRDTTLQLRAGPMDEAMAWLDRYGRFWQQSFDQLDTFLRENPKSNKTKETPS